MATYQDLTAYIYSSSPDDMVNIGWLGKESTFETGEIPELAWDELLKRASAPERLLRGFHDCERPSPHSERGFVSLGSGEIHVRGSDCLIMAAPTPILHYIASHTYKSPSEFVRALLADASTSDRS